MKTTMTKAQALSSRAGFELDVFVFQNVLDGLVDGLKADQIPSFSRRSDAAKVLMVKAIMEHEGFPLTIFFGKDQWQWAKAAGQVVDDNPIPMWQVTIAGIKGFGCSIEEAVTKMAIVDHYRGDRA